MSASANIWSTFFPLLNVRFISVSDSVDSYLDPRSVNNLVVPFKNILNDEYARDISNKVRASLDLKRPPGANSLARSRPTATAKTRMTIAVC